jgi:hypothetical protein
MYEPTFWQVRLHSINCSWHFNIDDFTPRNFVHFMSVIVLTADSIVLRYDYTVLTADSIVLMYGLVDPYHPSLNF